MHYFSKRAIQADAAAGLRKRSAEFLFRYEDGGDNVWLECETRLEKTEVNDHLIVTHTLRDIHKRKQNELILRKEAERDMLTGLYNRNAGTRMIEKVLSESEGSNTHVLILLDLDNFKTLNDMLGHQYGDQALKDVAKIIQHHFRKEDIVYRLGGDEFVIFLKNTSAELVQEKLEDLLNKLHLKYEQGEQFVQIGASAGIVARTSGETFDDLYQNADQALYQAKRNGKARFQEYLKPKM